jgi:hypothetical protein
VGDAGLAVGTGDTDDGHRATGISEKTADDMAVGAVELVDSDPVRVDLFAQQGNTLLRIGIGGIVDHRHGAGLDRVDGVVDAVGLDARQRDERRVGGNLGAIAGDVEDFYRGHRILYFESSQQLGQDHAGNFDVRHHAPLSLLWASVGRLSGATSRIRSAFEITSWNTGAATTPP